MCQPQDRSFSPHSCEVVETVFFTLFWSREPQKLVRPGMPFFRTKLPLHGCKVFCVMGKSG
jgi:hypothetical protein